MRRKEFLKRIELSPWSNHYWYLFYSYYSTLFGSFIFRGGKLRAFNFLVRIREGIKIKECVDWNLVFLVSMLNITPKVDLFLLRMGGGNKKVPLPISESKQISLAVKLLKSLSKSNKRTVNVDIMVNLISESLYNKGDAVQKNLDAHSLAILNRYLIRYFK
jgi:ribosomal protein S7